MILRLFRRRRSDVPERLQAAVVAAARRPALFAAVGVPDTLAGRFDMVALHLHLFLRRAKGDPALGELAQEVLDLAFAELDATLRQAGVGDLSVPKKMKRFAGLFYGAVRAYDRVLAEDEPDALVRLVGGSVLGGAGDPERLAAYVLAAERSLAAQPAEALLAGRLEFPEP